MFLFFAKQAKINVFYDILERKTPFQAIKTRRSKRRKIDIFPKGLTHCFSPKMAIFPTFFFSDNIGQKNVFYDIIERNNAFLGYKIKKFKKSKNWHFSKWVNPWFWSKNGHFSAFFFLGKRGQKNVCYDIVERKSVFLEYQNKKFKKTKN